MYNLARLFCLIIFLVLLGIGCGDDNKTVYMSPHPTVDRSCCPEPSQALLCGQCPEEKPCETTKPFTSLICTDSVFFYLKHAYPGQEVWYSYIQASTKGNPNPPNACCPSKECGIYQFWCTPEYPCSTENAWLFIYYQPFVSESEQGWILKELLPNGLTELWVIKTEN